MSSYALLYIIVASLSLSLLSVSRCSFSLSSFYCFPAGFADAAKRFRKGSSVRFVVLLAFPRIRARVCLCRACLLRTQVRQQGPCNRVRALISRYVWDERAPVSITWSRRPLGYPPFTLRLFFFFLIPCHFPFHGDPNPPRATFFQTSFTPQDEFLSFPSHFPPSIVSSAFTYRSTVRRTLFAPVWWTNRFVYAIIQRTFASFLTNLIY